MLNQTGRSGYLLILNFAKKFDKYQYQYEKAV